MFTWLREKIKQSILAGVNDALAEIQRPVPVEPVALELEHDPQPIEVNGPAAENGSKMTRLRRRERSGEAALTGKDKRK